MNNLGNGLEGTTLAVYWKLLPPFQPHFSNLWSDQYFLGHYLCNKEYVIILLLVKREGCRVLVSNIFQLKNVSVSHAIKERCCFSYTSTGAGGVGKSYNWDFGTCYRATFISLFLGTAAQCCQSDHIFFVMSSYGNLYLFYGAIGSISSIIIKICLQKILSFSRNCFLQALT